MRADYGQRYRDLYERHWWWRARERLILDTLRANQPVEGWKGILDVGCGDGLFFDELSQLGEVEGVEPAGYLIRQDGPHRSSIHLGPFDDTFRPGKDYSLILMLDVLEHLPDPAAALRRAMELLSPGGTLLVTVPAFRLLWTNHDVINEHFTRYTKSSLRRVVHHSGLRIEKEHYFFQWLFPWKLATRVAQRVLGLQPKAAQVPPQWLNRFLYTFSRLEQETWGALPIPFGSSLMVMGRKPSPPVPANCPVAGCV